MQARLVRSNRWGWCVLLLVWLSAGVQAQEKAPVVIRWFVGLGAGSNAEQMETQKKIVDEFNANQTAIHLELDCGCFGGLPTDKFATQIAAGTASDLVGPIGIELANRFAGEWLDLQPLVHSAQYDISQFPSNLVDVYRSPDGLLSLPFAVFPGMLYYNADLFDAAGLNYPPTVPGIPYIMPDGTEVPWDYDTVTLIAQRLTLDAKGHTPDSPDFDPDAIVQYGFVHQWDSLRSDFHTFGAAPLVNDNGDILFPENWRVQAHWMWDAIWTYHFMPSIGQDDLYFPNFFDMGQAAMARSMLWYTCCIDNLTARWDLAVQPAYQGQIYAPMDVDSFYIQKDTAHPKEAFTVMQYLMGQAAPRLMETYDAFPARPDLQAEALARESQKFPGVQNWDVVLTSIPLAPLPHQDSGIPDPEQTRSLLDDFLMKMRKPEGHTMTLDAELDQLQMDVQMNVVVDSDD